MPRAHCGGWRLGAGLRAVDGAPSGADVLDFGFVNYTTLGYGNVVPAERWRLLGPMTAMNGVLMFGWSTAVIFEVLRRAMHPAANAESEVTAVATMAVQRVHVTVVRGETADC